MPFGSLQASITVDLDVPFPFNATPKPVVEATGNAAFATTLQVMLDGESCPGLLNIKQASGRCST